MESDWLDLGRVRVGGSAVHRYLTKREIMAKVSAMLDEAGVE